MTTPIKELEDRIIRLIHEEEETTYALVFLYVNKLGLEGFPKNDKEKMKIILERLMRDTDRHHRMLETALEHLQKEERQAISC